MILLWTWIVVILASCRTLFPLPVEEKNLSTVQSWAYQLQKIDLPTIERGTYDLLVIDYSRDGTEGGIWSSAEIRRVKGSGSGKILLAYLSIGEAETHRSYWESSWMPGYPSWLAKAVLNTDGRPQRFHVKYWDPQWKEILKNSVDRMISQGFSGVLLDGCDVYTYWSDYQHGESEVLREAEAADRMVDLIVEISTYARNRVQDFIVCTQERTKLLSAASNTSKGEQYLEAIQGVVGAAIFFPGAAAADNPYVLQTDLVRYFQDLRSRGKVVLSLEYLSHANNVIDSYFQDAKRYGFLPYATNRALDALRTR